MGISSGCAMGAGVVVSGAVGSIDQVGWVGLEASVGVVIACHGSRGRADGLRWIAGGHAERARMKLEIEFSASSARGGSFRAHTATGTMDNDHAYGW